jgi:hypothetical protein
MKRAQIAWALSIIDVAVIVIVQAVSPDLNVLSLVLFTLGVASYTGIGALLVDRVPANPVGPLLSSIGTLVVATVSLTTYATLGAIQTPPLPAVEKIHVVGDALFIVPVVLAVVGVPLVFPDGRLPSQRYRWVVLAMIVGLTAWMLGALLGVGIDLIVLVTLPTAMIGGVAAIVRRFRGGDPVLRAQVKWLAAIVSVAAIAVLAGLLVTGVLPDLGTAFVIAGVLALAMMPLAIAIAILRYRLYEINRIVSRTVSWAIVSAVLFGAFAVVNLGLQEVAARALLGTGVAEIEGALVALSTLVVAVLFQPVRTRVQRFVDHRFNRSRYDADRMTQDFAARLRDEIDLGALAADLATTTAAAVEPRTVGLWLRADR